MARSQTGVPLRIRRESVTSALSLGRYVALALVVLGLTAQTAPTRHIILCNNTGSWAAFDVITVNGSGGARFCRKPNERATYSYTGTLYSVAVLAFKNENCGQPVIGGSSIAPNTEQRNAAGLIVAFERTHNGWRTRWLEARPAFRCESHWNQ